MSAVFTEKYICLMHHSFLYILHDNERTLILYDSSVLDSSDELKFINTCHHNVDTFFTKFLIKKFKNLKVGKTKKVCKNRTFGDFLKSFRNFQLMCKKRTKIIQIEIFFQRL